MKFTKALSLSCKESKFGKSITIYDQPTTLKGKFDILFKRAATSKDFWEKIENQRENQIVFNEEEQQAYFINADKELFKLLFEPVNIKSTTKMISGNNNIPYTYDNLCYALTDSLDERDKLKSELAEAQAKIDRQTARIRELEGSTNHAGGTPLAQALKQVNALKAELANSQKVNVAIHQLHTDQIYANRKLEQKLFEEEFKNSTAKADSQTSVLEDAVQVTSGPRRRDYDSPTPNHERIARLWNAYIQSRKTDAGEPLTPLDISHMMILLKLARAVYTPTRDSYVDIAGYAQCAAQISGFDPEASDCKSEPDDETNQTTT